jgi:hypothetical protein
MRNLFRWQYAVPRVLTVVVAMLAVQYGFCLRTRTQVAAEIESAIGAKGDVTTARVSFADNVVVLGDVRIADPRQPMRNLLQADRCELMFDAGPLSRQPLVGQGRISGLQFLTPRESSGAVPNALCTLPAEFMPFGDAESQAVTDWLRQLNDRFAADWTPQLESTQSTDGLVQRIPDEQAALQQRIVEFERRANALRAGAEAAALNPLRSDQFLVSLPAQLAELEAQSARLTVDVDALPDALESGRRAIVAARLRDERILREMLAGPAVDADSLTTYLLREQVNELLCEWIGWLQWVRETVPDDGEHSGTRLTLRNVKLEGTARLGGQAVELCGTLSDFSNQPELLNGPMRLRLASTGLPTLDLRASIDRSGAVARDELLVDCQGLPLPPAVLGRPEGVCLSMGPSVASVNVSLIVNGEQLSGDVQVVQTSVNIAACQADNCQHVPLAAELQDKLSKIGSVATRWSLSGTLTAPRSSVWSSLGPAASSAIEIAVRRSADNRARIVMADAQRRVDERLARLDREIADEQADFRPRLAATGGRLSSLSALCTAPQRLNFERLGHLPADSLFR